MAQDPGTPKGVAVYDRPKPSLFSPKNLMAALVSLAVAGVGLYEIVHHLH